MNCPKCDRSNPEDARFCIYCAVSLIAEEAAAATPTTGPTERLTTPPAITVSEPAPAPAPEPAQVPAPMAMAPAMPAIAWLNSRREKEIGGAVWLIGLGVLFLTGTFWPGILVLLGITGYVHETAQGRQAEAARSLIFFAGIAVLFWSGWFWPGILILMGLTALFSPEIRPRRSHA